MHFSRSKSTLDSLKRVFIKFRRKPSLGAPDKIPFVHSFYLFSFSSVLKLHDLLLLIIEKLGLRSFARILSTAHRENELGAKIII